MGMESTREFVLALPRVEECLQWDALVYWVADKAVGGKMFALIDPEPGERFRLSFAAASVEEYYRLLEVEGARPAPYLARAHWVALESWDVFPQGELHRLLQAAYERVEAKLPRRVQRLMELKDREYRAAVREAKASARAK